MELGVIVNYYYTCVLVYSLKHDKEGILFGLSVGHGNFSH